LFGVFATIVVERFHARVVLFTHRAAADDAQVVGTLATKMLESLDLSHNEGVKLLRASEIWSGLASQSTATRVQLIDEHGIVLLDSGELPEDGVNLAKLPAVRAALNGDAPEGDRAIDDSQVAAATPIVVKGKIIGVVRIVKNTFGMQEVLSDVAPKVTLLALILAGAAALAGIIIGRVLGSPIERLTLAAQKIASGQRQASLPIPRGREVKKLTVAFESMRKELEERHAMESLATDLSHELKNPVASIRASAEVLEDAMTEDPAAAKKFLLRIIESSEKLDTLTRDLLSLARLEAHGIEKTREVDLVSVTRTAIEALQEKSKRKDVRLVFDLNESVRVEGQAKWLQRAVENLITNAIDSSPSGASVSVMLTEGRGMAEIRITDTGPGIDPAVKDRVFERFVTTRHGSGGTGLGLAIVRAVAESHGGSVWVHSTGPEGTVMAMFIPNKNLK
ncbi:MAG: HAMP domain-containing protein, partial [Deltaproteobacteria bacterium]|nr:HAMP domain-containing protein [Deltaproteobacteria bacterium]